MAKEISADTPLHLQQHRLHYTYLAFVKGWWVALPHLSLCTGGRTEVEAGQKFIIPPVTARNLSSHVPETPKPMIRAITAARMTMTVVMLLGKKERTALVQSPPPSQPTPILSICRAVCRKEVEADG